jgi:hypothetical protein
MKLTKREFNRVIKEEIENMLNELEDSEEGSRLYQRVKGKEAELKEGEWKDSSTMRHAFGDQSKKLFRQGRPPHKFEFGDRSKKPSGQGSPPHKFEFGDPSARTEAPPSPSPQAQPLAKGIFETSDTSTGWEIYPPDGLSREGATIHFEDEAGGVIVPLEELRQILSNLQI